MSYTTRCPACGTMFKVVPDQLKISDGWVRCGHCADVFDATLYLEAWAPPAPAPARVADPKIAFTPTGASSIEPEQRPAEQVPVEQAPSSTLTAPEPVSEAAVAAAEPLWQSADSPTEPLIDPSRADQAPLAQATEAQGVESEVVSVAEVPVFADRAPVDASDWQQLTDHLAPAREEEPDASRLWPAAVNQPEFQPTPPMGLGAVPPVDVPPPEKRLAEPQPTATPLDSATEFQTELERFAAASAIANGRTLTDPAPVSEAMPSGFADPLTDEAAPFDEPGFVRQARRQARWRSPGVRAALGLFGVLLGVLLAGQWALHERDRLAASHPDLAPLLARLCEPLGCDIGPVKRIDAVVIDSSTLVRRLGNFYSFDLVLKNTAAMAVAVPALELTLTDSSDRVIARRVFLQQELPGTPELLPAQGNLALSLRLSINDVGAVPMAGYRALVFYP
jgi:predicted Zn finger-like uncharacterized protein